MFPAIEPQVLIAVGLAAAVTYALRFGGLMLAARFPKGGRFRQGMDALPGALLFSLVVPSIFSEGVWGLLATAVTAIVVIRSRNTLAAMLCGMLVIFVARKIGY